MKWPTRKTRKQIVSEEILNAISHGLMAIFSIIIFFMFYREYNKFEWPLFCFTLTMFILYLISCLYHSLSFTKAKIYFQRLDHICIYLLIWSSFLPFLFLKISLYELEIFFFILQSFLVLVGILFKIFKMNKGNKIHLICFLLLGWSGIFIIPKLASDFKEDYKILLFLLLGGFFYSIGVLFYKNLYKEYYHFIWHVFVILGNLCHVCSVWFYYGVINK